MGDSGTSSHITRGHLDSFIPFVLELNSVSYDIRLKHDKNRLEGIDINMGKDLTPAQRQSLKKIT